MWLALAATGFAALAIVAVTAAYAGGGTPDHRAFKTPAAVSSPAAASSPATGAPTSGAPTASPTSRATGSPSAAVPAGADCGPVAPHGVSCPAEPTCFDAKKRP